MAKSPHLIDPAALRTTGLERPLREKMKRAEQGRVYGNAKKWWGPDSDQLKLYQEYHEKTGKKEGIKRYYDEEGYIIRETEYAGGRKHGRHVHLEYKEDRGAYRYMDGVRWVVRGQWHRGVAAGLWTAKSVDTTHIQSSSADVFINPLCESVARFESHLHDPEDIDSIMDSGRGYTERVAVQEIMYGPGGAILGSHWVEVSSVTLMSVTPPYDHPHIMRVGKWISFYSTCNWSQGPLCEVEHYHRGRRHGLHERFDLEGKRSFHRYYNHGEEIVPAASQTVRGRDGEPPRERLCFRTLRGGPVPDEDLEPREMFLETDPGAAIEVVRREPEEPEDPTEPRGTKRKRLVTVNVIN